MKIYIVFDENCFTVMPGSFNTFKTLVEAEDYANQSFDHETDYSIFEHDISHLVGERT